MGTSKMLRFLTIVTIVSVVFAEKIDTKHYHGGYKPYYGGYNAYNPYYYGGYNAYPYGGYNPYLGGNNQASPLLGLLGPLLAGGLGGAVGGLATNAISGQQPAVPQTGTTTGIIGPNGQLIPPPGTTGTTGTTVN